MRQSLFIYLNLKFFYCISVKEKFFFYKFKTKFIMKALNFFQFKCII